MAGHMPAEAIADPDMQAKEGSLIDWNSDGVKEIFAVADQDAMTSPEHNFHLTLYDTGSRKAEQMVVTVDRNGGTRSEYAGTDPKLRAWFAERFDEYMAAGAMRDCVRAPTGALTCTKAEETDPDIANEPIDKLTVFTSQLIDDWVVANGADFTRGMLKLKFRPVPADVDLTAQACEIDAGDYQLYNNFKGPLLIARKSPREASVLYLQDGGHHREIPRVIVGRRYFWLALAEKDSILAIDRQSFEVLGMPVSKWKNGIPSPWSEGKTLADEQADLGMTKELQLEALDVVDGKMSYDDHPIVFDRSFQGLGDEFRNAKVCDGFEARP
jgi:hypothetical protein